MLKISPSTHAEIRMLAKAYCLTINTPADDMWESMIIPMGNVFLIQNKVPIGYYIVDDAAMMLQYYIVEGYQPQAAEIFKQIIKDEKIKGSRVGTFDTDFLNLSLGNNSSVAIDSLFYTEIASIPLASPHIGIVQNEATIADLDNVITFCKDKIDLEGEWVVQYYQNILPLGSIFIFRVNEEIVGIGEVRPSVSSPHYANLGMMVSKQWRRKKIGSYIMNRMKEIANTKGLKGICSTTIDNLASQKAISQAGFHAYHRMLKVLF